MAAILLQIASRWRAGEEHWNWMLQASGRVRLQRDREGGGDEVPADLRGVEEEDERGPRALDHRLREEHRERHVPRQLERPEVARPRRDEDADADAPDDHAGLGERDAGEPRPPGEEPDARD